MTLKTRHLRCESCGKELGKGRKHYCDDQCKFNGSRDANCRTCGIELENRQRFYCSILCWNTRSTPSLQALACPVCSRIYIRPADKISLGCCASCSKIVSNGEESIKRAKGLWDVWNELKWSEKRASIYLVKMALLIEQDGECASCSKLLMPDDACLLEDDEIKLLYRDIALDHDHDTGRVRGVLCTRCNVSLGMLQNSLKAAKGLVTYIQRAVLCDA